MNAFLAYMALGGIISFALNVYITEKPRREFALKELVDIGVLLAAVVIAVLAWPMALVVQIINYVENYKDRVDHERNVARLMREADQEADQDPLPES